MTMKLIFKPYIFLLLIIAELLSGKSIASEENIISTDRTKFVSESNEKAEKYFNKYLSNPNSVDGKKSVDLAFMHWKNARNYERAIEASKLIPYSDAIWEYIPNVILDASERDGKINVKSIQYLTNTLKQLKNPKYHTVALYELASAFDYMQQLDDAIPLYKKVINLNADTFYVKMSKLQLYEYEKLGIGNKAPDFVAVDIDRNIISLHKFQGNYVLLYFWSPTCGPCVGEFVYLRRAYKEFSKYNFKMIGVGIDSNEREIRSLIEKENLNKIQILGEWGKDNQIIDLYNAYRIPYIYLIDPNGTIIDKTGYRPDGFRGENIIIGLEKIFKH